MARRGLWVVGVLLALLVAAPAAQAAKRCGEPGSRWQRATPPQAGMDAAKVRAAIDYGTVNAGFAVRVYRHGCLVGEDSVNPEGRTGRFESWSLAKSVTAMVFGRAMTQELISRHDRIGGLITEADRPHGAVSIEQLLRMTSGLHWNGFRDYNIFMRDRLRDGLTVPFDKTPGTYFEYSQSGPALAAESVQRAVGEDFQSYAQRELFGPLGIGRGDWFWRRDQVGHTQGFFGLNMRPDDFGRLGDLLRRDGVWRGRRLLSHTFVRQALSASRTNGCYGWLIWINSRKPCVSPRVGSRPVSGSRDFPTLPPDLYRFSGLFGQVVAVFPSQDVMVVRTGQESSPAFSGGSSWEQGLYERVLGAITDQRVPRPRDAGDPNPETPDADRGFQTAVFNPEQYLPGIVQPPLPAAGPRRARAMQMRLLRPRASLRGFVNVRLACPGRWPGGPPGRCFGRATLEGAPRGRSYDIGPGEAQRFSFRLTARRRASLKRRGKLRLELATRNRDTLDGTPATEGLGVVRPPVAPRLRLLTRRLVVRRGRVRIRVACPRRGDTGCRGRLVLRSRRGRRLGSRTFRLGKGRRAVLRMRVRRSARGRARLAAKTSVRGGYSSIARRRVRVVR
ncbi:MAG TPA: serine hydrolase [Thermoleophilaceae bacterium]|nr:serine hydrolase [Thermoleophilaceae bacterium]